MATHAEEVANQLATILRVDDAQRAALVTLFGNPTYATEILAVQVASMLQALNGTTSWTPVFAIEEDGDRRVLAVVDWTGGVGDTPEAPLYIGDTGLTDDIAEATDIRGPAGGGGGGGGDVTALSTALSTEIVARAAGDSSLTTRQSTEESARATADTSLTSRVSSEEVTRAAADTSLTSRLSTEEGARAAADTSLTSRLSSEEVTRASADTSLATRISTEETARAAADTSLTSRLSSEEVTRAAADTSLTTRLSSEEVARAAADTSLTTRVSTEEVARTSADTSLTTRLSTAEITAKTESFLIALGDEATDITTGTAKTSFRMPYAFHLTAVRASLNAAGSGSSVFDINEGDSPTSILSTKLSIDASEKTSTTAATAVVISDADLADDALITFDIDTAGSGAKGAKIALIGYRA